jgi:hypothetical protein
MKADAHDTSAIDWQSEPKPPIYGGMANIFTAISSSSTDLRRHRRAKTHSLLIRDGELIIASGSKTKKTRR